MVTPLPDLKALERQAFRKFYEDGLLDLLLGLMMVCLPLGGLIQDRVGSEAAGMGVMLGVAVLLVASFIYIRLRLVRPRLGEFAPGPARRRRVTLTRLVLLGSAVIGVAAFGIGWWAGGEGPSPTALEVLLPLVWFVNATVVLGAMAHFLDVPRFYLYGVLFGLVGPLLIWPDAFWDVRVPPIVAFGIPAVPILAIGAWKLVHFLRAYPERTVPAPEVIRGD